jgi:diadenosine tetraphosphate (Ap4A) HIT family hydrolase
VHHVVRYRNDPAWPDPVWGRVPRREYTQRNLKAVQEKIVRQLGAIPDFTFAQ